MKPVYAIGVLALIAWLLLVATVYEKSREVTAANNRANSYQRQAALLSVALTDVEAANDKLSAAIDRSNANLVDGLEVMSEGRQALADCREALKLRIPKSPKFPSDKSLIYKNPVLPGYYFGNFDSSQPAAEVEGTR